MTCHQIETTVIDGPTKLYRHVCLACEESRETQANSWNGKCYGSVDVSDSLMSEKLREVGIETHCKFLGKKTGKTVRGCGCHVPNWQKQLYQCDVHEGGCVLLKLHRRPSQINCQTCRQYEAKPAEK